MTVSWLSLQAPFTRLTLSAEQLGAPSRPPHCLCLAISGHWGGHPARRKGNSSPAVFAWEGQILFPSVHRKKELVFLTLGLKGNETHSLWGCACRHPSSTGHLPDAFNWLQISLRSSVYSPLPAHYMSLNSTLNQSFIIIIIIITIITSFAQPDSL